MDIVSLICGSISSGGMVIAELTVISDTPLTDELRAWWTEDKYLARQWRDANGHYCALEALRELFGDKIGRLFVEPLSPHDIETCIQCANDELGHAAALRATATTERRLRADGRL